MSDSGYPAPLDGPAEERHDVTDSRRSSKSDTGSIKGKRRRSCPLSFGVTSYLHHFYDDNTFKDPSLYEEDDCQLLLRPTHRRRCMPRWWKTFTLAGLCVLVLGLLAMLLGYLVPRRRELMTLPGDPRAYLDERAQMYNLTLEAARLVGLVMFCCGGVTLTLALLVPSCVTSQGEEEEAEPGIKVPLPDDALPPVPAVIPSSSKVKNVQPEKKLQQRMMTSQTVIPEE